MHGLHRNYDFSFGDPILLPDSYLTHMRENIYLQVQHTSRFPASLKEKNPHNVIIDHTVNYL